MPEPRPVETDQLLVLEGIGWDQYESIRAATDHLSGLHLTYLDGALEIMRPSRRHERTTKLLARLVETYAEEMGIELEGFRSTTFRNREAQRGLEPDESYVVGGTKEQPDFAIEVVLTSGGVDKLEIYRSLRVPEVWFWVDGRLDLFGLAGTEYERIDRSLFLPGLDPIELAGIVAATGEGQQTQVVRSFRARLQARRRG